MRVSILRGGYRRPEWYPALLLLFHHAATAQSWSLDPDKAIKVDAVVGGKWIRRNWWESESVFFGTERLVSENKFVSLLGRC